jgi:hypothetical protein
MTNFWVGAYRLAGGPWAHHEEAEPIDPMIESPKDKDPEPSIAIQAAPSALKNSVPISKEPKGVSFGAGVKARTGLLFLGVHARYSRPRK